MTRALRCLGLLLAVTAAGCGMAGTRQAATEGARPRLIVQIVIDQMRADYVGRYGAQWTRGLRRLLDEGAYFTNARYPFSGTVTCAGHASRVPTIHW